VPEQVRGKLIGVSHVLGDIGRGLADGWWMFWQTLWALVLGFTLSGVVQAFVSRDRMQQLLGDHRPRTLARAGFFGAISSSCSYAASALAKTLFARGADFTAAQAFMFASTNLVVELGIVLWLLLSWQFALAEFVGGALMVVLLGLVLPRVIKSQDVDLLRRDLETADGGHHHHESSRRSWANAAGYTISDLTMLRRELVIGFVVAGFADALVPMSFWRSLFATGHGGWSSLENVALGPFLAIISFVCSIGNVPLAAALWSGGISFGGVVAFVFADLITLPLLFIYAKYYGPRITLRLLAVFWATMSVAGLATEGLFHLAQLTPAAPSADRTVGVDDFGFNATTVLDLVALIGFALLYLLYRRSRAEAAADYAKDPVCGMQVEKRHPGAVLVTEDATTYFCSDHCKHKFVTRSESAPVAADRTTE
jgi:uncharacterized membrane protein YraQ (UPF0718 family)/YHS domain-containing protein